MMGERFLRRFIAVSTFLLMMIWGVSLVQADDQAYTGELDDDHPSFTTTFDLREGESVYVEANATSGDLDTYLSLQNPEGVIIVENDDRDYSQLNSALGYTAFADGTYTITLSRLYDDSRGDYELKIVVGDITVLDSLDTQADEINLSGGDERVLDTAHFRIHYTLEGSDAVTEDYLRIVAKTMELVWRDQIVEKGWPAPPSDGRDGGDARLDVYLMDLLGEDGEGIMGAARPGHQYGDNPNTPAIEQYAASTLLRMDNDFEEMEDEGDPIALMRATAAHEFHHAVQHGYDIDDLTWYAEATATWMETQTFPKDQDATGYVENAYRYPELCFGTESDPDDGLVMYGEWLFLQSLTDAHGDKAVFKLWSDIAQLDGFDALAQTLEFFNDDIPNALARYRIQNIVRDYKFALQFNDVTVWLSDNITQSGRTTGYGVQGLGANYLAFNPPTGSYRVSLEGDTDEVLELWAVGINGREASVMPLGRGGVISNEGYEYVYVMVFNPTYNDDLYECKFADYHLEVAPSSAPIAPVTATWDATQFIPLTSGDED
jgi:hypothetical protein